MRTTQTFRGRALLQLHADAGVHPRKKASGCPTGWSLTHHG
jgi:hypothetical protein